MLGRTRSAFVIVSLVAACSSSDDGALQTPCVDGDVRCGKECSAAAPCPDGLYCNASGACAKDCAVGKTACPGGGTCMATGMCPVVAMPAGGAGGGGAGRAGVGGNPVSSNGGTGGAAACGNTTAMPTRVMPTVILVVDQSGSMNEMLSNGTRWDALRDSLINEPAGLVSALQQQVSFGLALYSARADEGEPVSGECPQITQVTPKLGNRADIASVYSMQEPIDETPTGDSIMKIANTLVPMSFDPIATPYAFILATDGEPDSCMDPNPEGMTASDAAKQLVVQAVAGAYARGIRTYVISVGDDLSMDHQLAVANAGVGHMAGTPDAQFWRAGDDASLRAALTAIVGTQISCDILLNGSVQGDACRGTVMLQGNKLACNDPNGWSLLDPTHIRLAGTACQGLSSDPNAVLNIMFPCDVFLQ